MHQLQEIQKFKYKKIINSFEAGGAFTGGPKLTLRRQELFEGVDNDEFSVIAFEAFNDRSLM